MRFITPALLALACLLPGATQAHVNLPPDTIDLLVEGSDPAFLGIEATFGLLLSSDFTAEQPTFRWTCHEVLSDQAASEVPVYVVGPNGDLIVTIRVLDLGRDPRETVYRSADGCDWSAPQGLTDTVVTDLDSWEGTDPVVLGTTATLGAGVANGIVRSTDGGATFSSSSLAIVDRYFRSVRFAQDGSAWAVAVEFDPLEAFAHVSTDGGETWEEHAIDPPGDPDGLLFSDILAAADATRAWVRLDGNAQDTLLLTEDGGQTWEAVLTLDGEIHHASFDDQGRIWLSTQFSGSMVSEDGRSFSVVDLAPRTRATEMGPDGVLFAVNSRVHGYALGELDEDGQPIELFRFVDLAGPLECGAGTAAAEVCDPLWEGVAQLIGQNLGDDDDDDDISVTPQDDDDDTGADDDDDGCSCAVTPRSSGAVLVSFLVVAIAVLSPRRRR